MNTTAPLNARRRIQYAIAALSGAIALNAAAPALAQHALMLQDHVPAAVKLDQAPKLKTLSNAKRLKLGFHLPLRNERELDQLIASLYDPQSPNFRHYLSVEEFTQRFAPAREDYDRLITWAKNNGFAVTHTAANRRLVVAEGTVANIQRALHLTLYRYRHPRENRSFFAPNREPTLSGLSVPLLHITGLDNYARRFTHLRHRRTQTLAANRTMTGSGPNGSYLPSDMRAAYYGRGPLDGAGQTVAIFSFNGYKKSDLDLYYRKTGMIASVPVKNVLVDGYSGVCDGGDGSGITPCEDGEQILDITNAIGMAPGLSQLLFYEGSSAAIVLNQIAVDNIAKSISCSWGGGDFGHVDDPIYKEFQAQGQTFVSASGDGGAYSSLMNWAPPSLNPNITQVGGTHLQTAGPGGAWVSETAWPESGGGYLHQAGYAIPSYQRLPGVATASNQASTHYRNDPDIALEGDNDNVTVNNGRFSDGWGGTSYAAPRLAGLVALANQQAANFDQAPVGYLNPTLYRLGIDSDYKNLFHDIVYGENGRFNAVPGYDLVTGWGSPIGPELIEALTAPSA